MSLPSLNRRKILNIANLEKNKFAAKRNEMKNRTQQKSNYHQTVNTIKKSDVSVSTNSHRKSDADKSLHKDTQEKGRPAHINL